MCRDDLLEGRLSDAQVNNNVSYRMATTQATQVNLQTQCIA